MIKIWSDQAWSDYCEFFNKHQKALIKGTHELLKTLSGTDLTKAKSSRKRSSTNFQATGADG